MEAEIRRRDEGGTTEKKEQVKAGRGREGVGVNGGREGECLVGSDGGTERKAGG